MATSIEGYPGVIVAETLAGTPGVVDLWYWLYEPVEEQVLHDACEPLMAPDERKRYLAFRFERDRRLFLATRLLVRTVLSRYATVSPGEWRFSADKLGKPRVVHPAIRPLPHFNLANTSGLVACAVTMAPNSIGVDAERVDRRVDCLGLATRYFSQAESGALAAAPPDQVARQFFTYWTLKEAYVKSRGLGLALPLDRFSFTIHDDVVDVTFHDGADVETEWGFASIDVPPDHLVAIAANTGGAALSVRAAAIAPLG